MPYVSLVLFLVGSTWFIELGGMDGEQIQYFNSTPTFKEVQLNTTEYLDSYVTRFKVDIPESQHAPPLAAVAALLDILSAMGFSIVSHNDEYRPTRSMLYLTWMLQKENSPLLDISMSTFEEQFPTTSTLTPNNKQ